MKALNTDKIIKGYLQFAIALCCSILVGTGCVWSFTVASNREVAQIEARSLEYDRAFTRQVMLAERADSLWYSIGLFNGGEMFNRTALQNRVSAQKIALNSMMDGMPAADVALYRKFSDMVNRVFHVKDSVRMLALREQLLKNDLQKCMQENRNAARNRHVAPGNQLRGRNGQK
jgi:hypothetical protein